MGMKMLARIIDGFKRSDRPLDLNELSRRLGIERSALDGMLQLLVYQGRLREVDSGTEACAHCAGRLSCASIQMSNVGKAYELVK